ncbi:hypothetical protein ACNKHL_14875 [Shigella flexneri]
MNIYHRKYRPGWRRQALFAWRIWSTGNLADPEMKDFATSGCHRLYSRLTVTSCRTSSLMLRSAAACADEVGGGA